MMKKGTIVKLVAAAVIVLILAATSVYVASAFVSNPSKNGTVRYIGSAGQDLLEWNGRLYRPLDSWSAYPDLKRGKYLGAVEGIDGLRAYIIKNDPYREYLLIYAGGWLMPDKVIFAEIRPDG
ncbi:MAG TPA: hypothetical protein GXZ65_02205 [Clostridiales bacterium]|mgnify:CR=1 FL=1|jgi:hypothetical protein|nr:hypothetical protein [Clostridiales bacterium]